MMQRNDNRWHWQLVDEEEYGETSPLITKFSLTKSYQKSKNLEGQDELVEAIFWLNYLAII